MSCCNTWGPGDCMHVAIPHMRRLPTPGIRTGEKRDSSVSGTSAVKKKKTLPLIFELLLAQGVGPTRVASRTRSSAPPAMRLGILFRTAGRSHSRCGAPLPSTKQRIVAARHSGDAERPRPSWSEPRQPPWLLSTWRVNGAGA